MMNHIHLFFGIKLDLDSDSFLVFHCFQDEYRVQINGLSNGKKKGTW